MILKDFSSQTFSQSVTWGNVIIDNDKMESVDVKNGQYGKPATKQRFTLPQPTLYFWRKSSNDRIISLSVVKMELQT
ncbi:MAG: hypothetical protein IPN13_07070 [Bacteroidetes bacterium]|nr:hypothetical protein [Bacteroidota bacterium]